MAKPLLSHKEQARLLALKRYQILDTPTETAFDDITELAASICGVPIASISFVDADRLWFKSMTGLAATEAPRVHSLCGQAIEHTAPLIIKDILADGRFTQNKLVSGSIGVRFYAGQPLITHDGFALGTLCILDYKPRELTNQQIESLAKLARQVVMQLEHRFNLIQLDHMSQILDRTSHMARIGGWELDLATSQLHWTKEVFAIHGLPEGNTPSLDEALSFYTADGQKQIKQAIARAISHQQAWDLELPFITAQKHEIWVRAQGTAIIENGQAVRLVGAFQDISAQKHDQIKLTWVNRALQLLRHCNQSLLHVRDERALIQEICKLIVEEGGYAFAWVGAVDQKNNTRIQPLGTHGNGEIYLAENSLSWQADTPIGNGPCGQAIRNGSMVWSDDIQSSTSPHTQLLRNYGYRSVVSLPLKDDTDEVIGLLAIYGEQAHQHSAEELSLLGNLADNLALGIVKIRREDERRRVSLAISKLAKALSAVSNDDFFEQLVFNMINTLNADGGYVARLMDIPALRLQTLAVVVDAEVKPNFEYPVSATMSEALFGDDSVKIIRADAYKHPVFRHLSLMRFYPYEAFAGFRLHNANHESFGLIFVFFKDKISESLEYLVRSTVAIFASRTASELERIEDAVRIQERAALIDKSHDAMIVRDMSHRVTYWNHAAQSLYGWSEQDVLHQPLDQLLGINPEEHAHATQQLLEYGEWFGDRVEYHKEGRAMVIETHATLVRDKFGEPRSIFSINNDITDRKHRENEIRKMAYHDTLTQLPNRRLFIEKLVQALAACQKHGKYGALFFIDLDNFKRLNDTHGHEAGDQLLQQVGQRLAALMRDSDMVARLGGDEFVILIDHIALDLETTQSSVSKIASKLLHTFEPPFDLDTVLYHSSPSIGAKLFGMEDQDPDLVLKQADMAMYASKKNGRNQFNFYHTNTQ